jgi:hypothetical protein
MQTLKSVSVSLPPKACIASTTTLSTAEHLVLIHTALLEANDKGDFEMEIRLLHQRARLLGYMSRPDHERISFIRLVVQKDRIMSVEAQIHAINYLLKNKQYFDQTYLSELKNMKVILLNSMGVKVHPRVERLRKARW